MKSKIIYSRYVTILTACLISVLLICCIKTVYGTPAFYLLLSVFLILAVFGCLYGAVYLKADSESITMGSLLKGRRIPMRNVESAELFRPTLGALRILGSGGFMGYWGIFREGDIGRYYAFYGKASDCFLVRMKNGDKYVLGCKNPQAMVDYIKSQIK